MSKQGFVYIMTDFNNSVIYTETTDDLIKEVFKHKKDFVGESAKKPNVSKLVYFETFDSIKNAEVRKKQIKAGSKVKKIKLIEDSNKNWKDLYSDILGSH